MAIDKADILANLEPLIQQAERENKWLVAFVMGDAIWLSPVELRQKNANDQFVWGRDNWQLGNPVDHLKVLKNLVIRAEEEVKRFENRMNR